MNPLSLLNQFKQYALAGLAIAFVVVSLLWRMEVSAHKLTTSKFDNFVTMQQLIVEQSKEENAKNKASYEKDIAEQRKKFIAINKDRNKIKGRLKDEIDSNTILRDAIKLRNESSSAGGMSKVSVNTRPLTEAERACNGAIQVTIDAGLSDNKDYHGLYEAWQTVCDKYGCD